MPIEDIVRKYWKEFVNQHENNNLFDIIAYG